MIARNNIVFFVLLIPCLILAMNPEAVDLFRIAGEDLAMGRIAQALDHYKQSFQQYPSINTLYNIGYTYKTAGQLDTAIEMYKQVLSADPNHDNAHLALGFAYLNKGDFVNGWQQHERYLKKHNKNADALRILMRNNNLQGKRIVCTYEGGIGDTFMFIRYVQLLKEQGAYTICALQKSVIPLLRRCPYIDELYDFEHTRIGQWDASSTLMSLPAVFNSTQETIPQNIPYIFANPALVHYWHNRIKKDKLNIGLCWQSDVYNDSSRLPIARRGMPLNAWSALLQTPGICVHSLQRFDGTEQIAALPDDCTLNVYADLDTQHEPFMDSAALIANMDLVISIDSAIAHVAGGMGKPVLLLLPYAVDWRWIYGKQQSPWYPTMTLYKQQEPFNWHTVVDTVYNHIQEKYGISITDNYVH